MNQDNFDGYFLVFVIGFILATIVFTFIISGTLQAVANQMCQLKGYPSAQTWVQSLDYQFSKLICKPIIVETPNCIIGC